MAPVVYNPRVHGTMQWGRKGGGAHTPNITVSIMHFLKIWAQLSTTSGLQVHNGILHVNTSQKMTRFMVELITDSFNSTTTPRMGIN